MRGRLLITAAICGLLLKMFSGVLGLSPDPAVRMLGNAGPPATPESAGLGVEPVVAVDAAVPVAAAVDLSDPGRSAPGFQPAAGSAVDAGVVPARPETVLVPAAATTPVASKVDATASIATASSEPLSTVVAAATASTPVVAATTAPSVTARPAVTSPIVATTVRSPIAAVLPDSPIAAVLPDSTVAPDTPTSEMTTVVPTTVDATVATSLGPPPGRGPAIDVARLPARTQGVEVSAISSSSGTPTMTDGVGAFRTFCGMSHMAFDDPIVAPGRSGASHLHTFFGNTGVDAFSTATSIAGSGGSTCRGGTANRSAYWVPSMIDTSTRTAIRPAFLISYYKSGYLGVSPSEINAFPPGLRMISGQATATAPDTNPSWRRPVSWNCGFDSAGNGTAFSAGMQACAPGQYVRLTISFPQCWDGRNLDSADHQSHMAWPDNIGCSSSHPVAVPQVTMNVYWPVPAGGNSSWRLASDMYSGGDAGWSGHADWWNGWDPAIEQVLIDRCVRAGIDCSVEMLGDGRELVGGAF